MSGIRRVLEIEGPLAACSECRFTTALTGTWSVEDGRLVWRGAEQVQPRRGPDLSGCCEGRNCGEFAGINVDDEPLSGEQVRTLRETDRVAREREMAEWEAQGR